MASQNSNPQPKRIIVLCDGTWQARESVVQPLHLHNIITPVWNQLWFTNVALLSQCIKPYATLPSGQTIQQVAFYQDGIGATGMKSSRWLVKKGIEGAFGISLRDKVREAYNFICDNYTKGDQIYLFGFSRGAYVARTVASLINYIGILSSEKCAISLTTLIEAFFYRDPSAPRTIEKAEESVYQALARWPSKNAMCSARTKGLRAQSRLGGPKEWILRAFTEDFRQNSLEEVKSRFPVVDVPPIEVVGVFDTVGAYGIPGTFGNQNERQYYSFFDPMLAPNIRHAYHALSLGEDREDFTPTVWYVPEDEEKEASEMRKGQILQQMWFQGTHSDVGGGHSWHGLSDIALAWMISKMVDKETPLLEIDLKKAKDLRDVRLPWAMQPQHRERPPIMFQLTRHVREWNLPKNIIWGGHVNKESTHEHIHHSVVVGGQYHPFKSIQFESLWKTRPSKLKNMWKKASDESLLGPAEKYLRWEESESYAARTESKYNTLFARLKANRLGFPINDPQSPPSRPFFVPKFSWKFFLHLCFLPAVIFANLLNIRVVINTRNLVPTDNLFPPILLVFLKHLDTNFERANETKYTHEIYNKSPKTENDEDVTEDSSKPKAITSGPNFDLRQQAKPLKQLPNETAFQPLEQVDIQ